MLKIRANLNVNIELIKLYWEIGKAVVERQKHEKWGAKVIERLGDDLQKEFPGIGVYRQTVGRENNYQLYLHHFYKAVEQLDLQGDCKKILLTTN